MRELERFGELLFNAIDDTIKLVLGDSASRLIYMSMEKQALLKHVVVGEKIEIFYAYLKKLLGSEGAQIIQKSSLKRLCLKLQREYEEIETYFSFLDELYEIKFELLTLSLKEQERSVCN